MATWLAGRACWVGAGRNSTWQRLAGSCRYGGGTGDGGAHGQQGQRHLGWRRGRGHVRDGGKVLAAMAAFVALNGRLGVNQLHSV